MKTITFGDYNQLEIISCYDMGSRCDLCVKMIKGGQMKSKKNGLVLCPDCQQFMDWFPDTSEKSIERYLIGNVV